MAHQIDHHTVKVIEQCQVCPPPGSVPSTSLPLSFFDLPWFYYHPVPVQRIFFYEFPHSTHHFLQTVLPTLKHSLSLTLQHFFPLSANLVFPPKPNIPHILYSDGDSVTFTVAESTADFTYLVADSPRDVRDLHPFVPVLPSPRTLEDGTQLIPSMAIQVTVVSNSGFSICITFSHVVADGRAFHHFMKFWAYVCKARGDLTSLEGSMALPLHNRDIMEDPNGLKQFHLEELWKVSLERTQWTSLVHDVPSDKVLRTFVLSRDQVEKLKKWVSIKCKSYGLGTLHISTFVVTCSLIWVCKVKSEETKVETLPNNDELFFLGFVADCRNLPKFSIPSTYFGNCLVGRCVALKRSNIFGENGIFEAAIAIGSKVRDMQREDLKGDERILSNARKFAKSGQHAITIAGSSKMGVYETDFGWGKPKMSEVVHIDDTGSINLSDCRDKEGGIQVGLALGRIHMMKFNTILEEHLRDIAVGD